MDGIRFSTFYRPSIICVVVPGLFWFGALVSGLWNNVQANDGVSGLVHFAARTRKRNPAVINRVL